MKKPVIFYALIIGFYTIVNFSCKDSVNSLPTEITGNYIVFAWNDLGMNCLNPTYNKLVILPPYYNVLVQVVKKVNPPVIVTSGIAVSHKLTTCFNLKNSN